MLSRDEETTKTAEARAFIDWSRAGDDVVRPALAVGSPMADRAMRNALGSLGAVEQGAEGRGKG
jgi:hypothetical protein